MTIEPPDHRHFSHIGLLHVLISTSSSQSTSTVSSGIRAKIQCGTGTNVSAMRKAHHGKPPLTTDPTTAPASTTQGEMTRIARYRGDCPVMLWVLSVTRHTYPSGMRATTNGTRSDVPFLGGGPASFPRSPTAPIIQISSGRASNDPATARTSVSGIRDDVRDGA